MDATTVGKLPPQFGVNLFGVLIVRMYRIILIRIREVVK